MTSHLWQRLTFLIHSPSPSSPATCLLSSHYLTPFIVKMTLMRNMDAGTKKPVVKGRLMYCSEKVHMAQAAKSGSTVLFSAHVEASMKKSLTRYPCLASRPIRNSPKKSKSGLVLCSRFENRRLPNCTQNENKWIEKTNLGLQRYQKSPKLIPDSQPSNFPSDRTQNGHSGIPVCSQKHVSDWSGNANTWT